MDRFAKRSIEIENLVGTYRTASLPSTFDGVELKEEFRYGANYSKNQYARLRVTCPHHILCDCSRSLSFSRTYGMAEVYGFLCCWIREAAPGNRFHEDIPGHRDYKPTKDEVVAFLTENNLV